MENNRLIISNDGMTWMDVTDMAKEVFNSGLFTLYEFLEEKDRVIRMPIESREDLLRALDSDRNIVIKVGQGIPRDSEEQVTLESWRNADKIQYNGYIYVRYADLRFCR